MEVKDSNSIIIADGNTEVEVKTLKVKGPSIQVKKGQVIKRIRLTDNE